jgi:drug/metabolite transporter (DMT)-like permease
MWFWLSIIALLCWSGSDLFSKIGCADARDKYSHYKMVTAVGVVMGLHAAFEVFVQGVEINMGVILKYLPVSALYILSMAIGYIGLRYIELSVSSPICNSSGAIVAIIAVAVALIHRDPIDMVPLQYVAVACVVAGVIGLGFVESHEDDALRAKRQEKANYKYAKSALAIVLPLIYCVLDALGTYADNRVLETLDEGSANVAYELTFLTCGIAAFIYVKLIRKQKYLPKKEGPKYLGAIFETAGQFAYIYAIADSDHIAMSAPIISSYCLVSVIWGRIFLKEKLSWKHYLAIGVAIAGIAILGFFDEG